MKIVIFTGAGFSKAFFNHKIQNDLLKDFLSASESKQYINYLPKELVQLAQATKDVELVMSHFLNMGYIGLPHDLNPSKQHQRAIIFFRMALALYFREKLKNEGIKYYEQECQYLIHEYIKDYSLSKDNLTFITTNYDLGLEYIVNDNDVLKKDSYYYPGFDNISNKGAEIPIFKLHGSVNWLEDRGSIESSGFSNCTRNGIHPHLFNELTIHPLPEPDEFTLQTNGIKYTPILIPFFQQKSQWFDLNKRWWGKQFKEIWKESFNRLVEADKIVFWGYGLPPADYHMFSFLLTVFKETNANIEIIDFSNQKKDSNLMKIANSIYKSKGKNPLLYYDGLVNFLKYEVET